MSKKEKKSAPAQKKKKSALFKFVLIPLVILAVLIAVIIAAINPIAKTAIENVAPHILGVKMKVEAIRIYPFRGRVELRKFTMYNPENCGYSSEYAMHFGFVNADIDLGTILNKKKIVLEEIALKDISINFETNMLTSNLQDILANIEKLAKEQEKKQKEENTPPPPNLQVNLFTMDNVGVYVVAKGTTKSGAGIPVKVDPLGPLGTDPEGITAFDFAMRVMGAIIVDSSKQGVIKISDAALKATDSLMKSGASALDGSTKLLKDTGKGIEKTGDELKKSVKKIFGK